MPRDPADHLRTAHSQWLRRQADSKDDIEKQLTAESSRDEAFGAALRLAISDVKGQLAVTNEPLNCITLA